MAAKRARHNSGKPPIGMVLDFPSALADIARVLEHGSEKYGADNWRGEGNQAQFISCAMRHLLEVNKDVRTGGKGLVADAESGQPHIAHCLANLLMLAEWAHDNTEG